MIGNILGLLVTAFCIFALYINYQAQNWGTVVIMAICVGFNIAMDLHHFIKG